MKFSLTVKLDKYACIQEIIKSSAKVDRIIQTGDQSPVENTFSLSLKIH